MMACILTWNQGIGTGGFKSNISPLLAEQIKQTRPEVITLKSGERVIKDPQVTISRVFLYFYMMINLGALSGGIGMVYAERYIGFWLSYALPTFLFFLAPLVLIACKKFVSKSELETSLELRARNLGLSQTTFGIDSCRFTPVEMIFYPQPLCV
jgi:POT family proton-dependent oligopeptide transporter